MEKYSFRTQGTCSQVINFELEGDVVHNISFIGGCNGNLKAISKLVDGMKVDDVVSKLAGNTCGMRSTSCADQLTVALKCAMDGELDPA